MKPAIVLVTVGNEEEGRCIAKALLEQKLVACVNLVPGIESHYWWEGKIQQDHEVLLVIKSSEENWESLVECVKSNHSYECPEIVFVRPEAVEERYRSWWEKSLG